MPVGVAVALGLAVGVAVVDGDAVGVGLGDGHPKISIESVAVAGAYPPASQIVSVPLVAVGKLRRAVVKGGPNDQVPPTGS